MLDFGNKHPEASSSRDLTIKSSPKEAFPLNRLALTVISLGLICQLHSVYQESCEPVLELPTPTPQAMPNQQASNHLLTARSFHSDPTAFGVRAKNSSRLKVTPLAQHRGDSQGQCSVAMAINCLTGKNLDDMDIDARYGSELLRALREECAPADYTWKDGGEIGPEAWELIEHKIEIEDTPIVLALNGPEFSASGRGHIVLVCGLNGDKVTFADPATGTTRTTTRHNINSAPSHPQGNFIFFADRL